MYSETDLEAAVVAGAITPDAAKALRNHVAAVRATPAADEESFRLLTGFNDIFVSIAIALLLTALAWIGGEISTPLGGLFVAAASWGLAEYFTRQRRMALPSILLLLSFVGGVAATQIGTLVEMEPDMSDTASALVLAVVGLISAGAAWLHWRRFTVPITVAAGAIALTGVALALVTSGLIQSGMDGDTVGRNIVWFVLPAGLATFAYAMWWDISDRARQTRRSDVAFWLHLAAAPMIAHPVFQLLGVMDGDVGIGQAVIVIALYIGFACVSLAVDRRALLVSSLAYVLFAMTALFEKFGAVSMSVALTALVIGSALLLLSAFWHHARRAVVGPLPERLKGSLPLVDRPVARAA